MNMRYERESRGLLQREVAAGMGMIPCHYSRIESGPREPTKQQVASFRNLMLIFDYNLWDEMESRDD